MDFIASGRSEWLEEYLSVLDPSSRMGEFSASNPNRHKICGLCCLHFARSSSGDAALVLRLLTRLLYQNNCTRGVIDHFKFARASVVTSRARGCCRRCSPALQITGTGIRCRSCSEPPQAAGTDVRCRWHSLSLQVAVTSTRCYRRSCWRLVVVTYGHCCASRCRSWTVLLPPRSVTTTVPVSQCSHPTLSPMVILAACRCRLLSPRYGMSSSARIHRAFAAARRELDAVDRTWLAEKVLFAHLPNAATKHAFGRELKATSMNPDMTELVDSIPITVRTVKDVETIDTLNQALCQLEGEE
ncbi:hypothetical protein PybrP1_010677 [[Pythium] brassicae (nom. inval.)]|nr:hypothetical protein PybrP1_010677 [[Pythium] brassicae (nom. inval.)]